MDTMAIVTQAIGIVAMIFNILSYQGKKATQIIVMQCIAAVLFTANYYLLGAMAGAMLNLFSVARALFLIKFKHPKKWTMAIFLPVIAVMYVLSFTVFGTEPTTRNFVVELLPTFGQIVQTIVFFNCDAKKIRYFSYIVSPCWLIYNVICFTIGGILCECFALVSITVGIIRYRQGGREKRQKIKVKFATNDYAFNVRRLIVKAK